VGDFESMRRINARGVNAKNKQKKKGHYKGALGLIV
jgi:hypothetical protein